ncbi:hypothetical protein [Erwinia tasmaniensis]|uniref:Uncharacterized protein n=1 Tax=Erwinia tasmaniensis (strain DSM 17950 / CFBP 7177 / CIP 109463 / NCPPB 4357 / Et1/99) TaxID=465817 RepID=B2VB27_ERWT9|nr:hypothetical protein [Erwinia tasmaniensis]CAO94949.1 hypothetical protein ETA_pET450050 [Erwinia tasmaniensis Et1/99]
MIVRLLTLEDMRGIFEEGWLFNCHLNMTRAEYFKKYGYGDDLGGYGFPLAETVGSAGELIKITDSSDLRIREGIALQFSDADF